MGISQYDPDAMGRSACNAGKQVGVRHKIIIEPKETSIRPAPQAVVAQGVGRDLKRTASSTLLEACREVIQETLHQEKSVGTHLEAL